tara:strand:- start:9 stop:158 length:150 start_codon:yes stop_codon:yes gene_type:complete
MLHKTVDRDLQNHYHPSQLAEVAVEVVKMVVAGLRQAGKWRLHQQPMVV